MFFFGLMFVSPKAAKHFVDDEHVRTLEDMQKLAHKLTKHQIIGLCSWVWYINC